MSGHDVRLIIKREPFKGNSLLLLGGTHVSTGDKSDFILQEHPGCAAHRLDTVTWGYTQVGTEA